MICKASDVLSNPYHDHDVGIRVPDSNSTARFSKLLKIIVQFFESRVQWVSIPPGSQTNMKQYRTHTDD